MTLESIKTDIVEVQCLRRSTYTKTELALLRLPLIGLKMSPTQSLPTSNLVLSALLMLRKTTIISSSLLLAFEEARAQSRCRVRISARHHCCLHARGSHGDLYCPSQGVRMFRKLTPNELYALFYRENLSGRYLFSYGEASLEVLGHNND